jgi:hypothetical protein
MNPAELYHPRIKYVIVFSQRQQKRCPATAPFKAKFNEAMSLSQA